ncbi:PepSY-like domain-containing protein [Echinicola sp. 20G]|uniref:PepSY-like domain-containing protein n=1 Tax=Echinicola sp. 20G TaxID=2781961 RepID=UPI001910814A|nr:PepSY-like domain-containing protein [Echinicola sp. 20G]
MKKQILFLAACMAYGFTQAQDIVSGQVPSLILNAFTTTYPKASDVEWEKEMKFYKVEFETGWNRDHEIWYDETGEMIKHQEDISVGELPEAVNNIINTDFKGYGIDDLERITSKDQVVYKMELNSLLQQDYDLVVDAKGNVLSKMVD